MHTNDPNIVALADIASNFIAIVGVGFGYSILLGAWIPAFNKQIGHSINLALVALFSLAVGYNVPYYSNLPLRMDILQFVILAWTAFAVLFVFLAWTYFCQLVLRSLAIAHGQKR